MYLTHTTCHSNYIPDDTKKYQDLQKDDTQKLAF